MDPRPVSTISHVPLSFTLSQPYQYICLCLFRSASECFGDFQATVRFQSIKCSRSLSYYGRSPTFLRPLTHQPITTPKILDYLGLHTQHISRSRRLKLRFEIQPRVSSHFVATMALLDEILGSTNFLYSFTSRDS
jgi:hypothetical protein